MNRTSVLYREFIDGWGEAIGMMNFLDAEDMWSWFSRGLSNKDRLELESGGYDEGLRCGREFVRLFMASAKELIEKGGVKQ